MGCGVRDLRSEAEPSPKQEEKSEREAPDQQVGRSTRQ